MNETKILFVLLIISMSSFVLKGQSSKNSLGFSLGNGISFMYGSNYYENPNTGFIVEFDYEKKLYQNISLKSGLFIEKKGARSTPHTSDLIDYDAVQFDYLYITIPILAQFSFNQKSNYYANIGPYFSFLIDESVLFLYDSKRTSRSSQTGYMKRFDLGLSAGIGRLFPVSSKTSISLELKNNLGLFNIRDMTHIINDEDFTLKHNVIYLLIGLKYQLM